jgi:uncharacterized protein
LRGAAIVLICPAPRRHQSSRQNALHSTAVIFHYTEENTMTISMYSASIPPISRSLTNLKAIIEKAAAHAEAKKIEPSVLINMRLYPDMFPLSRQIQIASDTAKGAASRLAGVDAPKYEDNETSFAELIARLDKTIAYLGTFKAAQIDGSEQKAITLPIPGGALNFTGIDYLTGFALPNLYFHVMAAYAILRHAGVDIGKMDFLGKVA